MHSEVVISDASTIIGLLNIGSLHLLKNLYNTVEITSVVKSEVQVNLPEWIIVNDDYDQIIYKSFVPSLDDGEASSIALALKHGDALLIIDEKKGRAKAKALGIRITGVIGIIIRAKNESFLDSGKEKLDQLINQGFRLSDNIYRLAIQKMGEES